MEYGVFEPHADNYMELLSVGKAMSGKSAKHFTDNVSILLVAGFFFALVGVEVKVCRKAHQQVYLYYDV